MVRRGGSDPGAHTPDARPPGDHPPGDHPPGDHIDGLRFWITELRRSPGARMSERRTVEPGELSIGDARVGDTPAVVEVDIESLADGVRVQAGVDFSWIGACRRCLGSATGDATAEILEMFVDDPPAYEATEASEGPEGSGETVFEIRQLSEGFIDLSDSVRDAILLGLPLAPLCGDDCQGPAPGDYPVGVVDDSMEQSSERPVDDRWSALDELEFSSDDFDPGDT